MRSLLCCGALAITLVFASAEGHAQQTEAAATQQEAPNSYIWSREMQERLLSLSVHMDANIAVGAKPCKGVADLRPLAVAVLEPLVFPVGALHPIRGTWITRYTFRRCGESVIYNGFFTANQDAAPTLYELPPGTTRTTPELILDMHSVLQSAADRLNARHHQGCSSLVIIDTKVTTEPTEMTIGQEAVAGVWEEEWRTRTCSGTFATTFCFIPERWGATTWMPYKCDPAHFTSRRR